MMRNSAFYYLGICAFWMAVGVFIALATPIWVALYVGMRFGMVE